MHRLYVLLVPKMRIHLVLLSFCRWWTVLKQDDLTRLIRYWPDARVYCWHLTSCTKHLRCKKLVLNNGISKTALDWHRIWSSSTAVPAKIKKNHPTGSSPYFLIESVSIRFGDGNLCLYTYIHIYIYIYVYIYINTAASIFLCQVLGLFLKYLGLVLKCPLACFETLWGPSASVKMCTSTGGSGRICPSLVDPLLIITPLTLKVNLLSPQKWYTPFLRGCCDLFLFDFFPA